MWRRFIDTDHSLQRGLPVFGVAFNSDVGTWSAFNEDTLTSLSEHDTEAQAHAACRRYEGAAFRRLQSGSGLAGLSHRAI